MRTVLDYVLEHPVAPAGDGRRDVVVWRGRQLPGDRPVAVKLAADGLDEAGRQIAEASLRREALVLRRARHRAIVPLVELIDPDRDDGPSPAGGCPVALVLEWAGGRTLAHLGRPPTTTEAVVIGAELAAALAALHATGLVHGQIDPAHVLVTDSGQVWLSGLSAVRSLSDAADTGRLEDVDALERLLTDLLDQAMHQDRQARHEAEPDRPTERAFPRWAGSDIVRPTGPDGDVGDRAEREQDDPLSQLRGKGDGPPDRAGSRRSWPRLAVVVVVMVALVGALGAVVSTAHGDRPAVAVTDATADSAGGVPADPPPDDRPADPATAEPAMCPGAAVDAPAGAVAVLGDPTGLGCEVAVRWWPDRAALDRPDPSGTVVHYVVGRPGDQLVLGDWSDSGTDTPALYSPDTGRIVRFDHWSELGGDVAATLVTDDAPTGGQARRRRGHPDQVLIDRP